MWEAIREYLTFTRKERYGVLFLLVVISLLFVLPHFFRKRPGDPDPATFEKLKTDIEKLRTTDRDSSVAATVTQYRSEYRKTGRSFIKEPLFNEKSKLFFFDPNTLTAAEWRQLGLHDHTIQTITHFLEKGGRFNKPEDIKKIYGLPSELCERLFPYIRMSKKPGLILQPTSSPGSTETEPRRYTPKKLETTDVNLADSLQWCRLPGIGSRLASRIAHFREKLGGFYATDQVAETFGLPDSTFRKIKPVLTCNSPNLVFIDINVATKEALKGHPYIGWQMANAIVEYRNQHGHFRSVDNLMQLGLMDSAKFIRLKPYLTAGP